MPRVAHMRRAQVSRLYYFDPPTPGEEFYCRSHVFEEIERRNEMGEEENVDFWIYKETDQQPEDHCAICSKKMVMKHHAQGSGRPSTPKPPSSSSGQSDQAPQKRLPSPLPKPGGPAPQGFQPKLREKLVDPLSGNPAGMSDMEKELARDSIDLANRLHNERGLNVPSDTKREMYQLMDMGAHPGLKKPKMTMAKMKAFIHKASLLLEDDGMTKWERLASKHVVGPLGRKKR